MQSFPCFSRIRRNLVTCSKRSWDIGILKTVSLLSVFSFLLNNSPVPKNLSFFLLVYADMYSMSSKLKTSQGFGDTNKPQRFSNEGLIASVLGDFRGK